MSTKHFFLVDNVSIINSIITCQLRILLGFFVLIKFLPETFWIVAEEGSHWIAGLPVTPVKSVNVDVQCSPITSYLSQLLQKEATMHKFADKSFRYRDIHGVVCRLFLFEGTQE